MPNLEYKKDSVCEGDLNLARNLLLKDVSIPGQEIFVLWYLRQFG